MVFLVRLVILPLTLMVMLSWSVFWMDRSLIGDRPACHSWASSRRLPICW